MPGTRYIHHLAGGRERGWKGEEPPAPQCARRSRQGRCSRGAHGGREDGGQARRSWPRSPPGGRRTEPLPAWPSLCATHRLAPGTRTPSAGLRDTAAPEADTCLNLSVPALRRGLRATAWAYTVTPLPGDPYPPPPASPAALSPRAPAQQLGRGAGGAGRREREKKVGEAEAGGRRPCPPPPARPAPLPHGHDFE